MTQTQGYYKIKVTGSDKEKVEQTLHFSMNAWYILREDSGKELSDLSVTLDSGTAEEKQLAIAEVIYSAAKANDTEHNLSIDYNLETVKSWLLEDITPDDLLGIVKALLWHTDTKEEVKKVSGDEKK